MIDGSLAGKRQKALGLGICLGCHFLGAGIQTDTHFQINQPTCNIHFWNLQLTSSYTSFKATTQTLTSIYSSRLATVAAINGACPAGGCALAMCCDPWPHLSASFFFFSLLLSDTYTNFQKKCSSFFPDDFNVDLERTIPEDWRIITLEGSMGLNEAGSSARSSPFSLLARSYFQHLSTFFNHDGMIYLPQVALGIPVPRNWCECLGVSML